MRADDFDVEDDQDKHLNEIKKYESDFITQQKKTLKERLAKVDKEH